LRKLKLKIILCLYNWVGCEVLEHVLQRGDIEEIAIFTHEVTPSAMADPSTIAVQKGIWMSTESINDVRLPFNPDIIASVYYRQVIKKHVIEAADGKVFNMHPSLLPRHRGCSSIPWAIIDGDSFTGVTFHYIDQGIDTGRVLLQAAIPITPSDTQESLYQRCMRTGAQYWPAAFELVKCNFHGVEQYGEPSFHKRGAPNNGVIDDNWPLDKIERFIRAMTYPPYPYATYEGISIRTLDEYLDLSRGSR